MSIGAHILSQPQISLLGCIKQVISAGGNVAQVFLRSMHSTSPKDRVQLSSAQQESISNLVRRSKIDLFVHASYMLNFCKVPAGLARIQWAYTILKEDMDLARAIGAKGVVIHMCSRQAVDPAWKPITMTEAEAADRMVEHVDFFFKQNPPTKKTPCLLLENTASRKTRIGGTMRSFGQVLRPLLASHGSQVGACIDTCHAFAAGYAINTIKGMKHLFSEYERYVGSLETIRLIHLNDSVRELGSGADLHAPIGRGRIWEKSFDSLRWLLNFAVENGIPLCLETKTSDLDEIAMLKELHSNNQVGGKVIPMSLILSHLAELRDAHRVLRNTMEANQYEKIITALKASHIESISSADELQKIPNVGKGTLAKVNELITTGQIQIVQTFRKDPKLKVLLRLTTVYGIGPVEAAKFYKMGARTVEDMKKMPLSSAQRLGLEYYDDLQKRVPRKEAEGIMQMILRAVRKMDPEARVRLAGSYHMGSQTSGDVDIVIISTKKILNDLVRTLEADGDVLGRFMGPSDNEFSGVVQTRNVARHIDIHLVPPEEEVFQMLSFGSGKAFSKMIRGRARKLGFKLNQSGLWKGSKMVPHITTEKDVFKTLGMKWVPPKGRRD